MCALYASRNMPTKTAKEKDLRTQTHSDIYAGSSTEDKGGHHDDKVEGMEITALSTASVSCIGNMSNIVTGFCD